MDAKTIAWHLDIGRLAGKESACGKKVDYKSEATAEKAAASMNKKSDRVLEAYPCYWCRGWHIGRKMT